MSLGENMSPGGNLSLGENMSPGGKFFLHYNQLKFKHLYTFLHLVISPFSFNSSVLIGSKS